MSSDSAPEPSAPAARPLQAAQGKTVAPGGPRLGARPTLRSAGVRQEKQPIYFVLLVCLCLGCGHRAEIQLLPPVAELPSNALIILRPANFSFRDGGSAEPKEMIIRSPGEWATVWEGGRISRETPSPPPAIDFDKYLLLYVTMGGCEMGDYFISFLGASETDTRVTVTIVETRPGPGTAIIPMTTYPAALALLPSTDKLIVFSRLKALLVSRGTE